MHARRHGEDFKPGTVKEINSRGTDTMKIDSSNANSLAVLQTAAPRAAGKIEAQTAVQQTSAVSSTVSLSSMSALHTAKTSDIDTAKVEAIKAALRDGSYKIDSGKIADGMIGTARDLLQTRAS
jgi:negative regulator of flagellin synthesis FlgM